MARTLLLLLALAAVRTCSRGQAGLSPTLRLLLHEQAVAAGGADDRAIARTMLRHDCWWSDGRWWLNAVALIDGAAFDEADLRGLGGRIGSRVGDMVTVLLPVHRLEDVAALPGVRYLDAGREVSPDLQHSRPDVRADSVQAGLGWLPQAYDGTGVVVAIIDWGFDYTHPVFRDAAMSGLRITRAWDQNKTAGPAPAGYGYGTEYVGEAALLAAGSDTLYVFGPTSHGTHVAGIAAGNGAGTAHIGMAPGAELVLVSLRRTDASYIDAIHWIHAHAQAVGKPFVVNHSFGQHGGAHDGTMPREVAMDQLAAQAGVFVGSAGNNGTGNFHLRKDFNGPADTLRTVVLSGSAQGYWGQTVSLWGTPGQPFGLTVLLAGAANATVWSTAQLSTGQEPMLNDTVVFAPGDTLVLKLVAEAASPYNGRPNMLLKVRETGPNKVVLRITSAGGTLHAWNCIELNNRTTNWGVGFGSGYPGATGGDNAYAVGEPGGTGHSIITVASHRAEQFDGQGQMMYGTLSSYSSRGPTTDGRTKPDLSAPGQNVRSSVSSFDATYATSAPQWVDFNGTLYPFDTYSGTSMSGPAVTGVAALLLQADPSLSNAQVKDILRTNARQDIRTGTIGPQGSLDWGWGKADAMKAMAAVLAPAGVAEARGGSMLLVFPVPADDVLWIARPVERVRILAMDGRVVREVPARAAGPPPVPLSIEGLAPGCYLAEVHGEGRVRVQRFVKR